MVRVVKPAEAPDILTTTGKIETSRNNRRYTRNPQTYARKPLPIKDGIYNDKTVKEALKVAQHAKCCFCEKSQLDEDGAVEHYRPKRGYSVTPRGKLQYPGYYWLCYSWSNLYLICDGCNRKKANYFPLYDESNRTKSHRDNLNLHKETPYILDPAGLEDPRMHLTFNRHFIQASSKLGQTTIEACGLDRAALTEERREFLKIIELLAASYKALIKTRKHKDLLQEVATQLKYYQSYANRFSAAVTDYLRTEGIIIN